MAASTLQEGYALPKPPFRNPDFYVNFLVLN